MTTILVTAAVIERDGRFLVTKRQRGVHLQGLWEFPGGKCEPGETLQACMARELREELDVDATVGPEIFAVEHEYPDRRVQLHFLQCEIAGTATPQQGQEMAWMTRADLDPRCFPPADAELIARLKRVAT